MSIFRDFFVKQKPIFTGLKFGFGSGGGAAAPGAISATGGESTYTSSGYKVHVFYTGTPSPQKVFTVNSGSGNIECFLVGSGGAGAYDSGGGGGGGACVYGTNIPVSPGSMNITVGATPARIGGYVPGSPYATYASNYQGKVSRIAHPGGNIDAAGGNSGGNTSPNPYTPNPFTYGVAPLPDGGTLGCGGGALKPSPVNVPIPATSLNSPYPTPSAGTFNVYRNKGGSVPSSVTAPWISGGGGGAGGVGGNAGPESTDGQSQSAGDGGAGYDAASNISWMTTSYGANGIFGGGGGAGGNDGTPERPGGVGGPGGGGDGGPGSSAGDDATANTGGGGGGSDSGSYDTGVGGSGAVFIAYQV